MIYASFTNVFKLRKYANFCFLMEIPMGLGAERRRTPAESRTVHQFLLAVNTNRRAMFVNFNKDLAVLVEPFSYEPSWITDDARVEAMTAPVKGQAELDYELSMAEVDLMFEGVEWDNVLSPSFNVEKVEPSDAYRIEPTEDGRRLREALDRMLKGQ